MSSNPTATAGIAARHSSLFADPIETSQPLVDAVLDPLIADASALAGGTEVLRCLWVVLDGFGSAAPRGVLLGAAPLIAPAQRQPRAHGGCGVVDFAHLGTWPRDAEPSGLRWGPVGFDSASDCLIAATRALHMLRASALVAAATRPGLLAAASTEADHSPGPAEAAGDAQSAHDTETGHLPGLGVAIGAAVLAEYRDRTCYTHTDRATVLAWATRDLSTLDPRHRVLRTGTGMPLIVQSALTGYLADLDRWRSRLADTPAPSRDAGVTAAAREVPGSVRELPGAVHVPGMIDLSDLGIEPPTSAATAAGAPAVDNGHQTPEAKRHGLVPGSALARSIYEVWAGSPIVVIDSPPGAGKTTLLVDLIENIGIRSNISIVVACPTRRGAADVAERLAVAFAEAHPEEKGRPVVQWEVARSEIPKGCAKNVGIGVRHVTIKTVASCAANPPECDVMIVDEAYQTTFSDVMSAADGADQVLMVGDPGQIGPVVTVDTRAWEGMREAPHRRAPEVFATREGATVLRLDATYRLGQRTVDAIAPLYGFPFESRRPDKFITDRNGTRLPEIASRIIEKPSGTSDVSMLVTVAETAASFVGMEVTETQRDGSVETRRIREADVAVVVSRNVQSSGIRAILDSYAMEGITVGTADSLQGGQWQAVVALDPVIGESSLGAHQLSEGRLCVMASRHMSALCWVHDGNAERVLHTYVEEFPEALKGIAVRRSLTADAPVI